MLNRSSLNKSTTRRLSEARQSQVVSHIRRLYGVGVCSYRARMCVCVSVCVSEARQSQVVSHFRRLYSVWECAHSARTHVCVSEARQSQVVSHIHRLYSVGVGRIARACVCVHVIACVCVCVCVWRRVVLFKAWLKEMVRNLVEG
jgi:hypothetical protein